jgi:hypothetical protein
MKAHWVVREWLQPSITSKLGRGEYNDAILLVKLTTRRLENWNPTAPFPVHLYAITFRIISPSSELRLDIKALTTHIEPTNMCTVLVQLQTKIACNERKQITRTAHKKKTTIKHILSKQRTILTRTRKTNELIPRHYYSAPANWKRRCRVPTEQRKTLRSSW